MLSNGLALYDLNCLLGATACDEEGPLISMFFAMAYSRIAWIVRSSSKVFLKDMKKKSYMQLSLSVRMVKCETSESTSCFIARRSSKG